MPCQAEAEKVTKFSNLALRKTSLLYVVHITCIETPFIGNASFFSSNITDCVKSLKTTFDDTQYPIDDDNIMLHRLGDRLEFLLHVGLRRMLGY